MANVQLSVEEVRSEIEKRKWVPEYQDFEYDVDGEQ